MFSKNIFMLVLVCGVPNVLCKDRNKVPCALDDSECTTSAAGQLFKTLIKGIPDMGVPSSDPLHKDVIYGLLKDFNYTFTDAYMYGMTDCTVKKHSINLQEATWNCVLHCPELTLKSKYEVNGSLAGNPVEGKGQCRIVHQKYIIGMRGGYETTTDSDGKTHFKIGQFDFDLLEVVENVKYEFANLYNGDEEKSRFMHKYVNDNWKSISSFTHYIAMHAFMSKMCENFNIYLEAVPANEIFYKDV